MPQRAHLRAIPVRHFIRFLFDGWQWDARNVHLAAFPRITRDKRTTQWHGFRLNRLAGELPDDTNNYFCIALLDPGTVGRGDRLVVGTPVLALDDVGSKVDADRVRRIMPPPHAVVETSPGNYSMFYRLLPGALPKAAAWARELLADLKLSDPGTLDASRYMRLPCGLNGKDLLHPFKVGLVSYSTRPAYDVDAVIRLLEAHQAIDPLAGTTHVMTRDQVERGSGLAPNQARAASMSDPWVKLAEALGMEPVLVRSGVIEAICPFVDEHTGGDETGFAFVNTDGTCKCHHGHCTERRTADFKRRMQERYAEQHPGDTGGAFMLRLELANDSYQQDMLARMEEIQMPKPSPDEFYDGVDALIDTATSRKDYTAEDKAREQQAAAKKLEDRAQDELADRFVVIEPGTAVWDRREKEIVALADFNSYAPVIKIAGYKGDKLRTAPDTLLLRSTARRAWGTITLPGELQELVISEGKSMVNLWRPTELVPEPGTPWLFYEHLEWAIPHRGERDELLWKLASLTQTPGQYSPVITLLWGKPGMGKDLLVNHLLRGVWGAHNLADIEATEIVSGYQGFLTSQFINVSEFSMALPKGDVAYALIKNWTGGGRMVRSINPRKYAPQFRTVIQPTFFLSANDDQALTGMPLNDRRIMPVGFTTASKQPPTWWARLAAAYDDPSFQAQVLNELLHAVTVPAGYNTQQPYRSGPTFAELLVGGLSENGRRAYEVATGKLAGRHIITAQEITGEIGDIGNRAVTAGMVRAGCVRLGEMVWNGRRLVFYTGASIEVAGIGITGQRRELLENMDNDAVISLYEAELSVF